MLDRARQARVRPQPLGLARHLRQGPFGARELGLDGAEDALAEPLVGHESGIAGGDAEIALGEHHVEVRTGTC
jgi:hypothetical protein